MRKRSFRRSALFLVVAAAAFGLAACAERIAEEAIEAETGGEVDVNANAGMVTIRGEEGEEMAFAGSEDGIEIPDDFPSTIPIYPEARAIQYMNMGEGVQAGFRVAATANDVRDWYIEQLEGQGWEIQMNMVTPDGAMVSAEREGESLSLMLGTDEGETTFIVTASQD